MSGIIAAAVVRRVRKRIVEYFTTAGATTADAAIAYIPRGRVETRLFDRMVAAGALREAQAGKFWLDEGKLAAFNKESLGKAIGIMALAGLAAAGAIAATG